MPSGFHSEQTTADGIHGIVAIEVADAAARLAYAYAAADIGKVIRQLDDDTLWILLDATPSFSGLGSGVPASRTIGTTAPLSGGGDLSADRTLSVADATTSAKGVVELATDGETAAGVAVQGNDSRLANARTPTSHASSHLPGGSDALATAVPVATGTANSEGSATSFARSDHVHDVGAHAARHQHGGSDEVATATPGANAIPKAGSGGTLAAGWLPAATTSAAGAVELATDGETAAGVAVQGNDTRLANARTPTAHATSHAPGGSDALATAAPGSTSLAATPSEGSSTSLARADHVHQSNTAPADVTKAAAAIGTSGEPARADHKHDVSTAAPPTALSASTSNAEGSATSLARSDHAHAITTGAPGASSLASTPSAGSSASLARADHVHQSNTAPSTIGTANAIGTSGEPARADHVHDHGSQTDPAHHAVATVLAAGFMSAGDKSNLDGLVAGISAFGATLVDDADASAARTTLGLGALATLGSVGTTQITDDAVTLPKIADISNKRVLGNLSGSSASPSELTASQVRELIGDASARVFEYFSSTTITLPSGCTGNEWCRFELWACGGPGGSGRRGAAGSTRGAGGGGGASGYAVWEGTLSTLVGLSLTIGAQGTVGAAVTTDDTNGAAGVAGSASTLGSLLNAQPGGAGGGGTTSGGTAGNAGVPNSGGIASSGVAGGGSTGGTGNPGVPRDGHNGNSGGGSGGAGINVSNTAGTPNAGGKSSSGSDGGAAGAAGGGAGGDGDARGSGGGGGRPSAGGVGYAGGAGTRYGAGGGGGSASLNGNNSGAGGQGAPAEARLVVFT